VKIEPEQVPELSPLFIGINACHIHRQEAQAGGEGRKDGDVGKKGPLMVPVSGGNGGCGSLEEREERRRGRKHPKKK